MFVFVIFIVFVPKRLPKGNVDAQCLHWVDALLKETISLDFSEKWCGIRMGIRVEVKCINGSEPSTLHDTTFIGST